VDAYRHFVGDGVTTMAHRALPEGARDPATVRRAVTRALASYATRWRRHTRPYTGVDVLLDGLGARRLPVVVYSNKPEAFTRQTVDALLDRWTFRLVRGARTGVPLKPDPTGALEIARELALAPADCLFCGDTRTDMETAARAGMHPVGALWGFRDRAELEASGAREVAASPSDLLTLL
jgi:phosphoglycolate phosphatase